MGPSFALQAYTGREQKLTAGKKSRFGSRPFEVHLEYVTFNILKISV